MMVEMNSQNLWFSHRKWEFIQNLKFSFHENRMCSTLHDGKQSCILLFMLVVYYSRISGQKIEFSIKTEILRKIKHLISMKIGYAQLHMMVNSCINFQSCWFNSIFNLVTKLNSQNVWFSDKKPEISPKNKRSIFIKIGYA